MNINLLTAAAVTAGLVLSGTAFAQNGTLDQTSPQEFVSFTNGQTWQQEVQVGLEGQLEGFTAYFLARNPNTSVTVNMYDSGSACAPGTLVFTDSFTPDTTDIVIPVFFDVTSLNLNYNVGDTFLLEFVPGPNNGDATFLGNNNKYDRGSMCGNGFPYEPGDAAFDTYMNPGSGIDPDIQITGTCPGSVTIDVSGATPNDTVALIFGFNQGSTPIPPALTCGGTVLDLAGQVQLVTTFSTDANGNAQFVGNAPAAACGRFLQVLDLNTCTTSNVVQIP